MLIGNRPQLQRTTSITRITLEVDDDQTASEDSDVAMPVVDGGDNYNHRFLGMLSPSNHRRSEIRDGGGSPSFLGNCGFCKRRLVPNRDIYMYKGEKAFCSIECREQQMEMDEGKTKNRVVLSRPK